MSAAWECPRCKKMNAPHVAQCSCPPGVESRGDLVKPQKGDGRMVKPQKGDGRIRLDDLDLYWPPMRGTSFTIA